MLPMGIFWKSPLFPPEEMQRTSGGGFIYLFICGKGFGAVA